MSAQQQLFSMFPPETATQQYCPTTAAFQYDFSSAFDPVLPLADSDPTFTFTPDPRPAKRLRTAPDLDYIDTFTANQLAHPKYGPTVPVITPVTPYLLKTPNTVSSQHSPPPPPSSIKVVKKKDKKGKKKDTPPMGISFVQENTKFPPGQQWLKTRPRARKGPIPAALRLAEAQKAAAEEELKEGETLSLEKHPDRIAAMMEEKLKENATKNFTQRMVENQRVHKGEPDQENLANTEAAQMLEQQMRNHAQGLVDDKSSPTTKPAQQPESLAATVALPVAQPALAVDNHAYQRTPPLAQEVQSASSLADVHFDLPLDFAVPISSPSRSRTMPGEFILQGVSGPRTQSLPGLQAPLSQKELQRSYPLQSTTNHRFMFNDGMPPTPLPSTPAPTLARQPLIQGTAAVGDGNPARTAIYHPSAYTFADLTQIYSPDDFWFGTQPTVPVQQNTSPPLDVHQWTQPSWPTMPVGNVNNTPIVPHPMTPQHAQFFAGVQYQQQQQQLQQQAQARQAQQAQMMTQNFYTSFTPTPSTTHSSPDSLPGLAGAVNAFGMASQHVSPQAYIHTPQAQAQPHDLSQKPMPMNRAANVFTRQVREPVLVGNNNPFVDAAQQGRRNMFSGGGV